MIIKLISWLGFLCSLIGLFYSMRSEGTDWFWWQNALATIAFASFIFFMIKDFLTRKGKKFKKYSTVIKYMHSWLSHNSKATIFTNDMTWAENDEKIQTLLFEKSQRKELTICMPIPTQLALQCSKRGAALITYEHLKYVPRSRFTIINDGRMDACVAVGRHEDGIHTIEEYQIGTHAVFATTNDLVEIIKKVGKVIKNGS